MITAMGRKGYISITRIDENDVIPPSSFHSMDNGKTLNPVINIDTIGQKPSDFSPERSFWIIDVIKTDSFSMGLED
jgi:hypothetical protein